jgi:hypothetical protein
MATFQDLLGTFQAFFHIGGSAGPRLKDNSGALESRNAADNAFVVHRVADPVGADDAVTKRALDAATASAASGAIRIPIGTTNVVSSSSLPSGSIQTRCKLDVTTPYPAGTTIQVGISGQPSLFMPSTANDPTTVGLDEESLDASFVGAASQVQVTFGGAPTSGAGFVIVEWVQPTS